MAATGAQTFFGRIRPADLLGHSDIMATEIYTHVQSARMIALHRKFHPRA